MKDAFTPFCTLLFFISALSCSEKPKKATTEPPTMVEQVPIIASQ